MGQPEVWTIKKMKILFAIWILILAVGPGTAGTLSTRISDPNAAPSINYNAKFELIMIEL